MPSLSRRHLLRASAAGAALGLVAPSTAMSTPALARPDEEPVFRISLAQWSLHKALFSGALDPLDFAFTARRTYEVEAIEYVNAFFKDKATDFTYLGDLATRAEGEGVESLLIMIDGEGALGDADDEARRRAIENHFKWIAAARFLGCHAIRVNAGGTGERADVAARASDSLHRLATVADDYAIDVIVENHGGYSSDGGWLAGVIRGADHERVGTLPDFGNFHVGDGVWYDRYQGVTELMPFARAVSAKTHDFDDHGNETRTDFRRMLKIVLDAGYRGWIGIEYEGEALPEPEGIAATRRLLERVRTDLGSEYR